MKCEGWLVNEEARPSGEYITPAGTQAMPTNEDPGHKPADACQSARRAS